MIETYRLPPKIITKPGDEYRDKTRQFQGIPGIAAAPSGRLWAVWYGGGTGEDRHNYVLAATCSGGVWSGPRLVIDPDGPGPVRAYDPCVWVDPFGRLRLFWAQGYEKHTDPDAGVWCIVTGDPDSDSPEWSEPERICGGVMMNKPVVLSSGEWLLPVARWHQDGSARVYCSLDRGGKWVLLGQADVPAAYRSCDEHHIVERRDGTLWMLVRTTYGIGQSISRDRGRTWTDAGPTGIPHPVSRFFIGRLDSGNLLLVRHASPEKPGERSHLSAYLSSDDGAVWSDGLLLDQRTGVSYPDICQDNSGTIYVIYDYDRKGEREILLAKIHEADIISGQLTDPGSSLRVLVNKAG
jgi:hypothetical protein